MKKLAVTMVALAALLALPCMAAALTLKGNPGGVSVQDFGASGSARTTTGSIIAGSNELSLPAPLDFADGQGISVANAGSLPSIPAPAGLTVTPTGGTNHYTYAVAALDGYGGVTAACTTSTSSGAAALNSTNYNKLATAELPGAADYAWWRTDGGAYGTGFIGISNDATTLKDTGLPVLTPPPGIPATPPAAPLGDLLVTRITSGAGTASLTLATNAAATVTGSVVSHDDTAAIQNAINDGSAIYFPAGTYPVSSTITVPSNKAISGAGSASVILATWPLSSGSHWWINMTMFKLDDPAGLTNVSFDNLAFDGGRMLPAVEGARPIDLLASNGADGVTVEDSQFYDAFCAVISQTPSENSYNNVVIRNNTVHDITIMPFGELRAINKLLIDGNTINNTGDDPTGTKWDAIYVQGGSDIAITNNHISNTSDNSIEVGSYDDTGSANHVPKHVLIANNYLANSNDSGIFIDPAVDVVVKANSIANTQDSSIAITDGNLNSSAVTEVPSNIKITDNTMDNAVLGAGIDFEVHGNYIRPTDAVYVTDNKIKNTHWDAIKFNIKSTGNTPGQTIVSGNIAEDIYDFIDNRTQNGITISKNTILDSKTTPINSDHEEATIIDNVISNSGGDHGGRAI